ncbi:helicase associated domain-containing protein [Pelagophyceae sp. CCMP2097]|nr:helicase associated domain-containing protein [Pelagophyceae sp. CCMP2097]
MLGALRLRAAARLPRARLSYLAPPDWGSHLLKLAAYRVEHGTCRVPRSWDAHFKLLLPYRAHYGDCAVPAGFVTADGVKLRTWANTQRQAYNAGELSPERRERLDAVGFVWSVRQSAPRQSRTRGDWDVRYLQLEAYREAHGDCAVPSDFAATNGTELGLWVGEQRRKYGAGVLSPERILRLEAVGFVWTADFGDDGSEQKFEALAAHGNAAPQSSAAADGARLGQWVMRQRQAYKAGKLSAEHIERLNSVGFAWRA